MAAGVIDAAIKPYFVLGGLVAALVLLGIGMLISWAALGKRRTAELAMGWPTTDGRVIAARRWRVPELRRNQTPPGAT